MIDSNKVIQWLQNWVCKKHENVEIVTLDNPGWGVTVNMEIEGLEVGKTTLIDIERNENDWYYCCIKNKKFEGNGGPYNLVNILSVLKNFIDSSNIDENDHQSLNLNDPVIWLQDWYFNQCNADWEHCFGVLIETTKKGWHIKIDLIETDLQGKKLAPEINYNSEDDWISYSVKDSIFNGFCSSLNLIQIINVFKNWAEG